MKPSARGSWTVAVFLGLVLLWGVFSWPVPRYFFTGISATDRNTESLDVRNMVAGDHLQLMYQFWLAADMLRGDTPLFHNVYEFNEGDDSVRYAPGSYYAPASLVYALGEALGGKAFGWNLAQLVSVLLTGYFAWLLAGRYTRSRLIQSVVVLTTTAFPYRWITLLSGSPTGFAMCFPPMLLYGLDCAIHEGKLRGGVLAGLAIFFSYCIDAHVFFFSVFLIPVWCLLAFLLARTTPFDWRSPRAYGRLALALSPTALLGVLAVVISMILARNLDNTDVAGGRDLLEVLRFSPPADGLWSWANLGVGNHAFFGITMAISLATILVVGSIAGIRTRRTREVLLLLLLGVAVAFAILMALGMRGPHEGIVVRAVRKLVPQYRMIRHPVKIFGLMPALLTVTLALGLELARTTFTAGRRRLLWLVPLIGLLAATVEYRFQIRSLVCLLDHDQPAYEAVAADAHARSVDPHVVIVTLWPGNSHWGSLYEYDASLYNIRILNGYSPVVPDSYMKLFLELQSINQGCFSEAQIEALRERKIDYVIFQEGPYPEKVSPFPVAAALRRMLNDTRFELIDHSGIAWAFRILPEPRALTPDPVPHWTLYPPARVWEIENWCGAEGTPMAAVDCSNGHFLRLSSKSAVIGQEGVADAPDLRWMARVRGKGTVAFSVVSDRPAATSRVTRVELGSTNSWQWVELPIAATSRVCSPALVMSTTHGYADLDVVLLAAGEWEIAPAVGETIRLPAPCFFRAGFTELATPGAPEGVVFLQTNEGQARIFYGPRLPLQPGRYRVEMLFSSPADAGTRLGYIGFDQPAVAGDLPEWPVIVGQPAVREIRIDHSTCWTFGFHFDRVADITIHAVIITRIQ